MQNLGSIRPGGAELWSKWVYLVFFLKENDNFLYSMWFVSSPSIGRVSDISWKLSRLHFKKHKLPFLNLTQKNQIKIEFRLHFSRSKGHHVCKPSHMGERTDGPPFKCKRNSIKISFRNPMFSYENNTFRSKGITRWESVKTGEARIATIIISKLPSSEKRKTRQILN